MNPDEARSLFLSSKVDARDVDFSDRVNAKRKSYKTSSRKQRQGEDAEEYGDFSDDEREGLERKLARLKREVEEAKEDYARLQAQRSKDEQPTSHEDDIAALSNVLHHISTNDGHGLSTYGEFARTFGSSGSANGSTHTRKEDTNNFTITYAPAYQHNHALAKAADFDDRLSMLERSLGLSGSDLPTTTSKAILPSLDALSQRLLLLTTSTPSSLDNVSRRVRTLTQETERLEESRKAAKAAKDALRAAGGDVTEEEGEDSEQVAKINALYGTLSTIETLSPVLPLLLDRLRSLRAIHADAASAGESLERIEQKQNEQADEIKKWRDGLEKVEAAIKNGEATMSGNVKTVEGWVKDLEKKVQSL